MKMFLVLAAFLFSILKAEAITAFYYTPGEDQWTYMTIGETRQIDLSADNFRLSMEPLYESVDNKGFRFMSIDMGPDDFGFLSFWIDPTNRIPLGPGGYIGNRFPIEDYNDLGFSWGQDGRMANDSTTWVTILEVEYGPDGIVPTTLAMDFIHFENTNNRLDVSWWEDLYSIGSFRYNSSIPLTTSIPEPASVFLMAVATLFFLHRRR